MRSLTSTLLAEQKKGLRNPLWKIALSNNGSSYTYEKDRVKVIYHIESETKGLAQVLLDNTDKTFTSLNLMGFQGIISYGMVTSAGDEYSPTAPLWVLTQQTFSLGSGDLYCQLNLGGLLNLLNADKGESRYEPDSSDTNTIKDLISAICGATLAPYTNYTAITVTYDSEDSIIDSFQPKDYFRVNLNESRLSAIKRLLGWTGCVMRVEDDGALHILVPRVETSTAWQASTPYSLRDEVVPTTATGYIYVCTTAGTSGGSEPTWATGTGDKISDGGVVWTVAYDYQYELATDDAGKHTFFDKSYRERIVTPNYITVKSHSSHAEQFSGNAQVSGYASLPAKLKKRQTYELRISSNAQGTSIAQAIVSKLEIDAQRGSGRVPMNVGAEVYDFNYLIDEREGDARNGIVKQISRHCNANQRQFEMDMSFGLLAESPTTFMMPTDLTTAADYTTMDFGLLVDQMMHLQEQINTLWDAWSNQYEILVGILSYLQTLNLDKESAKITELTVEKLYVTVELQIPSEAA